MNIAVEYRGILTNVQDGIKLPTLPLAGTNLDGNGTAHFVCRKQIASNQREVEETSGSPLQIHILSTLI